MILAAVFILLGARLIDVSYAQEVASLQIDSKAYIVLDADTGEIFAQKNAHDHRAMASLTKIFTATEALHRASLDHQIVTHSSDLVSSDATQVGFGPGETFTLEDLLYGMLLPSGNDAANAIARNLGTKSGDKDDAASTQRFMDWMNARIKAMGLKDTNLVNPSGWGVPNHYSSAYDLATFMRYAIQNPEFLSIIGTAEYTTSNGYYFTNTNKILGTTENLIGGKTGYDEDSGYCLIEVGQKDGHTMISVTLDGVAPDDWYDDDVVLLNYAYDQVEARDGKIEGEIASYTDPGLADLAAVNETAGVSGGAAVNDAKAVAKPTTAPVEANSQPVANDPAPTSVANDSSPPAHAETPALLSASTPGWCWEFAVACAVALAFVGLAGRPLRGADPGFSAVVVPAVRSIIHSASGGSKGGSSSPAKATGESGGSD